MQTVHKVHGGKSTIIDFVLFMVVPFIVVVCLISIFGKYYTPVPESSTSGHQRRGLETFLLLLFAPSFIFLFVSRRRTLTVTPTEIQEKRILGRIYRYPITAIQKIKPHVYEGEKNGIVVDLYNGKSYLYEVSKDTNVTDIEESLRLSGYPYNAEEEVIVNNSEQVVKKSYVNTTVFFIALGFIGMLVGAIVWSLVPFFPTSYNMLFTIAIVCVVVPWVLNLIYFIYWAVKK